ncbi:MAG TPA: outer membrane beta-barrel protein [Steroidobacteraceae bacterium]|jgi:outer membrane protein with beta-barrel domain|nr:outer membrane beta-barrel protein [Steroidobacteraceae bacterium]
MRKYILAATALAATLGATTALAVDNGIYVGASVGDASVDINQGGFDIDDSATAFKVNVGWRILDWAGIEANYVDLGEVDGEFNGLGLEGEPLEYEADGINFSGLLFLPVGPVDLFARAGFISWGTKARLPDIEGASDSDDGMDLSYGAGAQFRVWSLSLRAEYEVFDVNPDKVDMISLGIMWTFL